MPKKIHIACIEIIITEAEVPRRKYRESEATVFIQYTKSNLPKRIIILRDYHQIFQSDERTERN